MLSQLQFRVWLKHVIGLVVLIFFTFIILQLFNIFLQTVSPLKPALAIYFFIFWLILVWVFLSLALGLLILIIQLRLC